VATYQTRGGTALTLDVRPESPARSGAEILGRRSLEGPQRHPPSPAIRRAWLEHLVIFFRDQDLPPARFLAFARRFGEPIEYPFVEGPRRVFP